MMTMKFLMVPLFFQEFYINVWEFFILKQEESMKEKSSCLLWNY